MENKNKEVVELVECIFDLKFSEHHKKLFEEIYSKCGISPYLLIPRKELNKK